MKKYCGYVLMLFLAISSMAQTETDTSKIEEFVYDTEHDLKIYCVRPENYNPKQEYPAIVIFHGGGWSIGEASWGFSSAEHYASKGMVAFSVQYRLENREQNTTPYEAVLDAQKAIRWLRKNANKFSINTNKIAAYGWSAGAHLAACAAVFENLNAEHEKFSSAPNLLLLKSPAVTLTPYSDFPRRLKGKIDVLGISPAESVSETTPPSIIIIGRDDTVTPLAGAQLYKDNMDKFGIECELNIYDGVGHLFTPSTEPDNGWPNPDMEVRQAAHKTLDDFLEKHGYFKS